MKKNIIFVFLFFIQITSFCQVNEIGKITISVVMPNNVDGLNQANLQKLENKILQILTNNAIGATGYKNDFVIYPMFEIYESKSVEGGLENLVMLNSQLSLYIKNVKSNLVFATINKSLVGTGKDKQQALTNSISRINVNDKDFQSFIEVGKNKIVAYYAANCDDMIRNAESLSQKQEYEQAIGLLLSIPKEVSCYKKATDKSIEVYKAYQNQKCLVQLQNAKTELSGNNYSSALNILSHIDPSTNCNKEAQALIQKIEPKVDAAEREALKIQMKIYDDAVQLEKQRIQAVKDIAVAYYNRTQPTYNYLYIIK
jgi:hypothetical protein